MKKRGQGEIIGKFLVVLLGIVAIVIVYSLVNSIIKETEKSIEEKKFESNTKIFPTHHGEGIKPSEDGIFFTTPEMAKKLSLLDLNKEEFTNKIVSMTTPRPMNYSVIIKVNKGTIPIIEEQVPDLEMGPNRCSIQ